MKFILETFMMFSLLFSTVLANAQEEDSIPAFSTVASTTAVGTGLVISIGSGQAMNFDERFVGGGWNTHSIDPIPDRFANRLIGAEIRVSGVDFQTAFLGTESNAYPERTFRLATEADVRAFDNLRLQYLRDGAMGLNVRLDNTIRNRIARNRSTLVFGALVTAGGLVARTAQALDAAYGEDGDNEVEFEDVDVSQ